MKVKIISGWSDIGGSTIAQINLCNLLNDNGIDCEFYGPHDWHTNKCKGFNFNKVEPDDRDLDFLIIHYPPPIPKDLLSLNTRKRIFSSREKDVYSLRSRDLSYYHVIHFVSHSQRLWHNLPDDYNYIVIPNVWDDLKMKVSKLTDTAGVIGSIDLNKRTDLSIRRALLYYPKVLIYGKIIDQSYFKSSVETLLSDNVIYRGVEEDRQKMYESIDAVFHSSISETFNLVKSECIATGTHYMGSFSSETDAEYLPREEILNLWRKAFE